MCVQLCMCFCTYIYLCVHVCVCAYLVAHHLVPSILLLSLNILSGGINIEKFILYH